MGTDSDVRRVRLVRRIAGKADIRVDANGAWDMATALEAIEKIRAFNISVVEQPTPKGDLNAMQEVADFCREPVMADESLCTKDDALKLAQIQGCDMFNVRLSKCGGIFRSMEIIKTEENWLTAGIIFLTSFPGSYKKTANSPKSLRRRFTRRFRGRRMSKPTSSSIAMTEKPDSANI